jgi:hypothetical protein
MEFVRIGRLKDALIRGPLSAFDTAKYLAVQGALISILFIPSPTDAPPDWTFGAYPLSALAGVYYCYKRNGGSAGIRLAERFLAIGWVVGIRVAFCIVIPAFVGVFVLAFAGFLFEGLDDETVGDGLRVAGLGLMLFMYWRMGIHLADVHSATVDGRTEKA